MRSSRVRLASLIVVLLGAFASVPPAVAGEDAREVKGRALFAKGEYQAALEIYANLFAENGDTIYLRNIGRCYQKLRQPAKAIDSFQEYLRRSSRLRASERREVDGFIQEMRALKAEQEAEAKVETTRAPPPPPPPPAEPPPKPEPDRAPGNGAPAVNGHPNTSPIVPKRDQVTPPPDTGGGGGGMPLVHTTADNDGGAPSGGEGKPVTKQWWFWTGIGAVAIGAVVAGVMLTRGGGTTRPSCDTGFVCQ